MTVLRDSFEITRGGAPPGGMASRLVGAPQHHRPHRRRWGSYLDGPQSTGTASWPAVNAEASRSWAVRYDSDRRPGPAAGSSGRCATRYILGVSVAEHGSEVSNWPTWRAWEPSWVPARQSAHLYPSVNPVS